jgi:tetratricopeptide (TPR) repeat protein
MIAAAFVLGLAAFGAVAWFAGRSKPPQFDDHRVIVSDFENLTRDASLDPVGKLASDLLTQSITQTDVAEVAASTEATGDTAKAGLIVRGRYYKESDSIRVQAEILDARTSRVVRAIDPVTAAVTSPTKALDQLRPRILGAIASLNDPLIATWARKATQPPLYEAYIAYRAGIDADYVRPGQSAGVSNTAVRAQYSKAVALDSMFILPMVNTLPLVNVGGSPIIAKRFADRDKLTPVDRALIESRMAADRLDWETAYRALRQACVLAPDPMILIQFAQVAIYAGRPHEAVSAMKRADPEGKLKFGWGIRTDALHLSRDLQSELAAVERERELGLAIDYEAGQILPALGKVAEVNALINDRMRRASDDEQTPALLMLFAAREYRAHGFVRESDELANRAIAWYQSRPPSEMTSNREFNVISAFFQAGRLQEARSMIEEIIRRNPAARKDPDIIAFLGRIAARTGDSAAARSYMQRLVEIAQADTTSGRRDTQPYFRALIAAGLGDKAMAVTLLQQAFAEGWQYDPYLHREIEFQAIQDYPPMKELLWPDG